ncbi:MULTISPECIES: hypothetical protein [Sorangium]|uniref:Uncharacterized protein n=1 Tax=Sorangium cellulosum TaxID=56 RepID=A0A4P2QGP8_SORCE|nr:MULTISPECIES: hypothetical protein [Sorangium]AUX29117.1 uncharacterized protein SOCE836_012040 [Sorangium cellulosum]WCQ88508.1 hypothetical protein NQZ70_01186 [Sorangium sp. Soce836]
MERARTKPPHPASVAQTKAAPAKKERPPHLATVAQTKAAPAKKERPPHPATAAQTKATPAKKEKPPHPATVAQTKAVPAKKEKPPHPATVAQTKAVPAKKEKPPHPATVAQPRPAMRGVAVRPPHPSTAGAATVTARRSGAGAVQRSERSEVASFIAVDSLAAYCEWAKEHAIELRGKGGRRLWKEYGDRIKDKVGRDRAFNKEVALLRRLDGRGKGTRWDEVASVDDLLDKLEKLYKGEPRLSTLIITGHANESAHNLGQGNLNISEDLDLGRDDADIYEALQLHRSEITTYGLSLGHWPGVFERLRPIACPEGRHNRFYVFLLGCNSGGPPPSTQGGNFLLNKIADVLFVNVFRRRIGVGVFGASLETVSVDTERILRHIDQIKDAGKPWFNFKKWEAADAYEDGEPGLYGVFRDPS